MKKILMLISIVIIGVALVGCKNSEKVQEDKVENDDNQIRKVITSYLEDGKKLDLESMSKKEKIEKIDNNLLTDSKEDFVEDKELMISIGQEMSKTLKPYTKETKFDIKNVKVDGNNANVQTEVKYLDFSLPVENAFADMNNIVMNLMDKSGGDTSEADMFQALIEGSKENIEANIDAYGKEYNTVNIDFKMEKVNDKWLIAGYDDDALLNVLTLNAYSVVDKEFGGNSEGSDVKEVKMGEEFQLGKHNIIVNDVIKKNGSDGGTFLVFDVTWTNNTDETLSWEGQSKDGKSFNSKAFQNGIEIMGVAPLNEENNGNAMTDIRPNTTLENVKVVFEARDTSDIELELSYNDGFTDTDVVQIKTKFPN